MSDGWKGLAGLALVLVISGCGIGAPASGSAAPTATAGAATRTPLPSPTPVAGLPSELLGEWHADLAEFLAEDERCDVCGTQIRLIIRPDGTAIIAGYGGFQPGGRFTIRNDLITFERISLAGEGPGCGEGVYRWRLRVESLTFSAVEHDPCGRRGETLDGITYTRAD